MKKMQCEVCGSSEIKKVSDDVFECQSCGVQYSKNDIQKLLVEITGKVKIDHSDRVENLYVLARADIDKPNGNALKYYESILLDEPTSWEANFFVGYMKAWECKMNELRSASADYCVHLESVISFLKNTVESKEEQTIAIETIYSRSKKLHDSLVNAAKRNFENDSSKNPVVFRNDLASLYEAKMEKLKIQNNAKNEFYRDCNIIFTIMSELGNILEKYFPDNQKANECAINAWKTFAEEYSELAQMSKIDVMKETANKYIEKIKQYDTEYSLPVIAIETTETSKNKNSITSSAENLIRFLGILSCVPYTCIAGFLIPLFIKKAKIENNGVLSKKTKQWSIIGIVFATVWTLLFVILMMSIS